MRMIREKQDVDAVPANCYRGAVQSAHQQRRHAAVLDLVKDLRGSALDVGCGYGDLTWAISKIFDPVYAVDVDPKRVAFASEQYAPIPFTVCQADGLSFADASFDNVVSIVVLPFVPDLDAHMAELKRVLKPGGHLLLATRTSSGISKFYRRISGRGGHSSLHHHSVAEAKELLEKHGFELVRCSAIYDPPFVNRRNLGDWVNSTLEWIGEATGSVRLAPYPMFLARRRLP